MQPAGIFALWKDTESGGKGEDYTELLRKGTLRLSLRGHYVISLMTASLR
jgi:hypothetical protein